MFNPNDRLGLVQSEKESDKKTKCMISITKKTIICIT